MIVIKEKKNCVGCGACANICPKNVINMLADEEGFLYPKVSEDLCINCGLCDNVCPVSKEENKLELEKAYACYAKDDNERLSSSSGGIFAVLARKYLEDGGVVCGAAYNDSVEVEHIIIDQVDDLYRLKGTKYVQSVIGDTYGKIQLYLKEGKKVLFSGTPCQVAGLKTYLRKDYDNLLCLDLICHGVPSPMVFKEFLRQSRPNDKVTSFSFRNKENGLQNITIDMEINNKDVIKEKYADCKYIVGFIQNLYTRPSCFDCHFKGNHRYSDITIGDYWGINEFHPGFSDDYGTSAIIVHTNKGYDEIHKVKDDLNIIETTVDNIANWNECLLKSVSYNTKREEFFRKFNNQSFNQCIDDLKTIVVQKKPSLLKRIIRKIKR